MQREEIEALWDEYRISKCYPSCLDRVVANSLYQLGENDVEVEYTLYEASSYDCKPRPGSPYWYETLWPPLWFIAQVQDLDPLAILKEASKTGRKPPEPFKYGKRRRRRKKSE